MIRALVDPGVLGSDIEITLTREESHHFAVRRGSVGDRIAVVDGVGTVARGVVTCAESPVRVMIDQIESMPHPGKLVLAVGAGDRERFGWLVEKAAELEVTDVIPLRTSRSASVASGVKDEQIAKLNRRAREAIKQSGSAWAPVVASVASIGWLVEQSWEGVRWLAEHGGGSPLRIAPPQDFVIAVGPEGGFDESEHGRLIAGGFQPVALGRRTLRFETAALVGAGIAGLLRAGRLQ